MQEATLSNVSEWSTSAASNNAAAPDGWPEGMAPSAVNDAARENMAALAKWYKDANGSLVTTGTGTAYLLTTNSAHATLAAQSLIVAEINTDSTGAATLNVDSLGAKSITLPDGGAIAAGTLQAGTIAVFAYEAGADSYVLIAGANLGTAAALDTGTASGNIPVLGSTGLDVSLGAVPIGAELDYAGSSAPTGYLLCDGSAVSRTTYAALFTAISTTFGVGDGSTTFNVPDRRGRVTIGAGTGTGLTARALGATGGAETVTLTAAQMPSHTHSLQIPNQTYDLSVASSVNRATGTSITSNTITVSGTGILNTAGSGDAHANMQPFGVATKIIRAL